ENKANMVARCPMDANLQTPLCAFGYKLPGYFMEYGPIHARDEAEARTVIRQRIGVKRLPMGLRVWNLAERPLRRWQVADAS
ncbi:MAG TPA: hypothetical protein PKL14_11105, partial [Holophaga sp.]|nr:hypothetical protein [Holophaga sp.]